MSHISNTEKLKTTRFRTRQTVAASIVMVGVFLSISHISNATDDHLLKPLVIGKPATFGQQIFKTPFNSLQKNLIKNIRAAIAAKWQASQLHNLVEAIISKPGQSSDLLSTTTQPANSFKPFIGQTMVYDSNYLRIANNNTTIGQERSKSEFIKQIRAGIAAKWSIRRQVLLVKAIIDQNWYSTNSELDYLGRDIQIDWNWQLSQYFKGNIGYDNKVTRGNFSYLNTLINNLQSTSQFFANGEYNFNPNWFLQGGVIYRISTNTKALESNNLTETIGMVGIKYVTPSLNQIGLKVVNTNGEFPNRRFKLGDINDNAYARYDFNIEWAWQYSIKTRIEGSVGYARQISEHIAARNFTEPTAKINASWFLSDKTALIFSGWRDVQLSYSINANFVLSEGIGITPTWLASPKLQFKLPMSYEIQSYLGDPGFVGSQTSKAEQDKISLIGLVAEYAPFTNGKMSLFFQHEGRSSNNLARNYQSNAVGLDMQLNF